MQIGSLIMLAASALALIIGPFLFRLFASRQHFFRLMDGFIVVLITGIVIVEVMPEVFAHMPLLGSVLLLAGFAGPTILERLFHRAARQVHHTALIIGVAGIVLHTIMDGAVLVDPVTETGHLLGWGVILHRLPAGITIWWLIEPRYGKRVAMGILLLMVVGTIAGFYVGSGFMALNTEAGALALKAFVAGAILHVVIHRPQSANFRGVGQKRGFMRWAEGIGNLAGLAVFGLLLWFEAEPISGHNHAAAFSGSTGDIFWGMAMESAPALLLAYLFGGLIGEFLPATSIRWMQRGPAMGRAVKGMAVGLPLPICTCGVLPLYQTLVKKGAPASAAMAFLIATPELGIDALLISIPLLGGDMTIVRIVAAATIALLIGWLVGTWTERTTTPLTDTAPEPAEKEHLPTGKRLKKGLSYGFGGLVDDTAPWILAGLLVAALAHPVLGQGWIQSLPAGLDVLFFAMIGLPIYVCASGATPIVAVLLINGVSPGAALAFLLTGPATNVSTFGILSRLHSQNVALVFGVTTMSIAVGLGILVNTAWPNMALLTAADLDLENHGWLQQLSLAILFAIFLASLLRRGARGFVGEVTSNFQFGSGHVHHHDHGDDDHADHDHGANGKHSHAPAASCNEHCAHC
ncbi:MAG: permease [Bacteroidota bacterium]